jgi:gluconate 5-dehydrogenase
MEKFRLDGKRALITGGSRGIGFGIAKALTAAGAQTALIARNPERLEAARKELEKIGGRVWTYPFDMIHTEQIESLYAKIVEETGGIDILVNNAGGTRRNPAESQTLEDWNFVINLNLTSIFVLSKAFGKELIKSKKSGKIINIASLMSETVRENNTPYAASKGGVRQLTKALAVDWARYGINVNAIGPGYIRTELTQPLWEDPDFDRWVKGRTPLGRWGNPEDLGNVAVFLASPASDFITGQVIYADGGWLSTF